MDMSFSKLAVLVASSLFLAWFTWWSALRFGRWYGVARFFAFMSVVVLVVLNTDAWFADPFSPQQIVSWVLLGLATYVVAHGAILLKLKGRPRNGMEDSEQLVRAGPFRLIRHPMYSSLVILAAGVLAKRLNAMSGVLFAICVVSALITAIGEEKEMVQAFGDEYRAYMKGTRRFLPYLL